MASKTAATIDEWTRSLLRADPPRSKSLIVTVFGDAVAPRTSGFWLNELVELMAPFKMNARLVRTSNFRLVEEGWFESRGRDGRRSLYELTQFGRSQLAHAHSRIYEPPPSAWNGEWTLVVLSKLGNAVAERVELRDELKWEGFGQLTPNIFLHPTPDLSVVEEKLKKVDLTERAVVLRAQDAKVSNGRPLEMLVDECWNLDGVASRYRQFLRRFQPLLDIVSRRAAPDPQTAFITQTLLIHAYRRATLHDPRLPVEMLPKDWPGQTAYELCRTVYAITRGPSHEHLAAHMSQAAEVVDKRRRFAL